LDVAGVDANVGQGLSGPWTADSLLVACLDLGSNKALAAFAERFGPGFMPIAESANAYTGAGVRRHLVTHLSEALKKEPVALGLEGPLWGLSSGALGP
jgi:hypothetical protein